jgi:zinc transporter, ZIP family
MGPVLWCVAAGGGTSLGALLLSVWRRPSANAYDLALAGSAGVMLAATVLGLLPAALDAGTFGQVAAGFAVAVLAIGWLDRGLAGWYERFRRHRAAQHGADRLDERNHRAIMLTGAISLHNLPEGMAVGIAFAAGGTELGVALAIAILVHNVPEGLAVAMPLRAAGMSLPRAIGWATLTGVVEIVGALGAYVLGTSVDAVLPWGLAFAAGAMLYVVIDELVPAAHEGGKQRASMAFLMAFLGMATIMHLLGGFIATGGS